LCHLGAGGNLHPLAVGLVADFSNPAGLMEAV
jgi:hypothetical protein